METAIGLPMYGYVHFLPCVSDYPSSGTPAQVAIGRRELLLKVRTTSGETREGSFKVTKMRCWRIMTVGGGRDNDICCDNEASSRPQKLELSFEYLMNDGDLQWVTVTSSQAILMSLCLQSIVEELLRMRNGSKLKIVRHFFKYFLKISNKIFS